MTVKMTINGQEVHGWRKWLTVAIVLPITAAIIFGAMVLVGLVSLSILPLVIIMGILAAVFGLVQWVGALFKR